MFVLEAFALGSLAYAGGRLLFRRKPTPVASQPRPEQTLLNPEGTLKQGRHAVTMAQAKRDMCVSQAALGLALAGAVLRLPLFSLVSLPAMLLVFAPVYAEAWRSLRTRRMDTHLLDATRISVCVVMGYTVLAAFNALLHAYSQRLFLRSEEEFGKSLQESLGQEERIAWIEYEGIEMQMPLEQVKPGMIMVLRNGDDALAAGVVTAGCATGCMRFAEDQSFEIHPGDRVAIGSMILAGTISVQIETVTEISCPLYGQLQETPLVQTPLQRIGEGTGGQMAPWMLIAFAFSTPLMGVNRAASFLTTSFGAQMHRLSPYTLRQFLGFAGRHGIFIHRPRALELANLVNTVIFDARTLNHPSARPHCAGIIQALRIRSWPSAAALSRPFSVFVMAQSEEEGRSLEKEMGLDGYFVEYEDNRRAALIEGLQLGGRLVCYVSADGRDTATMEAAMLSVEVREPAKLGKTQADIVLLDQRMRGLPGVFELALAFADRQRFNLVAPIAVDLIDISTTVFLHFGLVYSILLSYSGLLSSVAQARMPNSRPVSLPQSAFLDRESEEGQKLLL